MLIDSSGRSSHGSVTAGAGEEVSTRAAWLTLDLLEGEAGITLAGREDLAERGERIDGVSCFSKCECFGGSSIPKSGDELLRISAGAAIVVVVVESGVEETNFCNLHMFVFRWLTTGYTATHAPIPRLYHVERLPSACVRKGLRNAPRKRSPAGRSIYYLVESQWSAEINMHRPLLQHHCRA